jgi:hypothetical protein
MRITRRAQSGKFRSSSQSRNSIQIQARAEGDGASEPVVVDVVDLQCARVAVAQYEIAFAKHTAEVADARMGGWSQNSSRFEFANPQVVPA